MPRPRVSRLRHAPPAPLAPRTAPCPACRAKDTFPDRALVPWARVRAGATFRAWVDHPGHADRYLSVAFQLEPRKSTLTPRILTSMRWGARPVAFLAPRHGGAWDNEFMSHRRIRTTSAGTA